MEDYMIDLDWECWWLVLKVEVEDEDHSKPKYSWQNIWVLEEQTLEFVLEADAEVELKKQKLLMMNEVVLMMCEMVLASVIQESLMQLQQMNV